MSGIDSDLKGQYLEFAQNVDEVRRFDEIVLDETSKETWLHKLGRSLFSY